MVQGLAGARRRPDRLSGLRIPTTRLLPFALALAAGLAQAASIALPWNGRPQWWLQLLSLAALAALVQRAPSWKSAALRGWVFATAWLAGTFWWLFISMHVYGGLAAPLAALAVLALAAFLGGYYAVVLGCFWPLARMGIARAAINFGALWLLAELLRATWFTGFPWGAGGYAHVEGPLAVLAPWLGVYGIGFVAAALAYALVRFVGESRWRSWRGWAAVAAVALVWLPFALEAQAERSAQLAAAMPPAMSVALLQGNIPQDEKFEEGTGVPLALGWYATRLRDSTATLVVAPETAIPALPSQLPDGYIDAIRTRFGSGAQAALVGIPLGSFEEGYSNSVLGFAPGVPRYRYDKHHLVPFGEFVPPLFKWFTRMMNIPLGDFNRGGLGQPSLPWQGQRIAPNVCYEDLFGEELAVRFRDPATAPTVFVNFSNIAWFGDTVAIDQHLAISRMRALEFRRPMLRATNTGATAVIDHTGEVTALLPRLTRGVLHASFQGRTGTTFYADWASRLALYPYWAVGLAPLVFAAALRLRRRAAAPA
jgi:apolipoprotein N-acyltransferase